MVALVFSAILFALFPHPVNAQKKVVVVTVNTADLDDLLENETFENVAKNGILGLMNTKSSGKNNQYKPYLTLGSGEKSEVYFECIESSNCEGASKIKYENVTLNNCIKDNIANIYINRLFQINSDTLYGAIPGRLGSLLKYNNLKTGFIGGFRYDNSIKSPAFFIAMDEHGIVDTGEIENVFKNGTLNYDELYQAFLRYRDASDFLVVELGDLETLYNERRLYSEESYAIAKKNIIDSYAAAIGFMISNMNFDESIMCIISPYCTNGIHKGSEILCPIMIYDGGKTKGAAISNTTRRCGIISALDFAPYILDYFDIVHNDFVGYTIKNVDVGNNLDYIKKLNADVVNTSLARLPLLKGFAFFAISVIILYSVVFFKMLHKWYGMVYFLMEFCLLIPFSMLIEGSIRFGPIFLKGLFIVSLSLLLSVLINKLFASMDDRTMFIMALCVISLICDLIFDMGLLKGSVLSYDPIIGARFYGLGNEYLGVIAACSLFLGNHLIYKGVDKIAVYLMLFSIACIIGMPSLGANIGGMLTSSISFAFYVLRRENVDLKKSAGFGILISLAILIGIAFLNLASKAESHLGNMLRQIYEKGFDYGLKLINRKFMMAVKLIKYTIWTRVLIAIILVFTLISNVPKFDKRIEILKLRYKSLSQVDNKIVAKSLSLRQVWISILVASCAAVLLNDSGIITAAIIMLYALFGIILLVRPERMR